MIENIFLKIAGVSQEDILRTISEEPCMDEHVLNMNVAIFPKSLDTDKGLRNMVDVHILLPAQFRKVIYDGFGEPLYNRQGKADETKGHDRCLQGIFRTKES